MCFITRFKAFFLTEHSATSSKKLKSLVLFEYLALSLRLFLDILTEEACQKFSQDPLHTTRLVFKMASATRVVQAIRNFLIGVSVINDCSHPCIMKE